MKPLDQLWIRACKSGDPKKRLLSVYRRFYSRFVFDSGYSEKYILSILLDICKKHCPIDPTHVVSDFLSTKNIYFNYPGKHPEDYEIFYNVVLNHIRFMEVKKIEGLTKPARFRD